MTVNGPDPTMLVVSVVIALALASMWLVALADIARREPWDFPPLASGADSRPIWLFVVILGNGVGSLIYYVLVMRPHPRKR